MPDAHVPLLTSLLIFNYQGKVKDLCRYQNLFYLSSIGYYCDFTTSAGSRWRVCHLGVSRTCQAGECGIDA